MRSRREESIEVLDLEKKRAEVSSQTYLLLQQRVSFRGWKVLSSSGTGNLAFYLFRLLMSKKNETYSPLNTSSSCANELPISYNSFCPPKLHHFAPPSLLES